jgi:hypothetical protein
MCLYTCHLSEKRKKNSRKRKKFQKKKNAKEFVPTDGDRSGPWIGLDIRDSPLERKLEQGLEEGMAGSDPVSITQPSPTKTRKA